jgi:hypothetical protein
MDRGSLMLDHERELGSAVDHRGCVMDGHFHKGMFAVRGTRCTTGS